MEMTLAFQIFSEAEDMEVTSHFEGRTELKCTNFVANSITENLFFFFFNNSILAIARVCPAEYVGTWFYFSFTLFLVLCFTVIYSIQFKKL